MKRKTIGIFTTAIIMTVGVAYNAVWNQENYNNSIGEIVQNTQTHKKTKNNIVSEQMMIEIQKVLKENGYYKDKVDGKFGHNTKNAIVNFQKSNGLNSDGIPSTKLLSQIIKSTDKEKLNSIIKTVEEAPQTKTAKVNVETNPTPVATPLDTTLATPLVNANNKMIAKIQIGLRNYGYDEIVVDGEIGQITQNAIQRFQLDFGMKISGEPNKIVLDKLKEIGAYNQGAI